MEPLVSLDDQLQWRRSGGARGGGICPRTQGLGGAKLRASLPRIYRFKRPGLIRFAMWD